MGKRIVFYSQHMVGVGHHFRNREIVRALAREHQVFFVDGGRQIPGDELATSVERIRLAPIFASETGLASEDPDRRIQEVLLARQQVLCEAIKRIDPDVLMIEFFPFGRWALRAELIAAIETARSVNCGVKVICSLRDIPPRAKTPDIVGMPMPQAWVANGRWLFYSVPFGGPQHLDTLMARRYYAEVCPTLNTCFDALLVHGDPQVTRLEEHFPWVADIEIPVVYTGYVSEKVEMGNRERPLSQPFVMVSAGGGAEAYELIVPCIEAWKSLIDQGKTDGRVMAIFTGPFVQEEQVASLQQMCDGGPFRLARFASDFPAWMQAADLSISRAGYNTCMNVLETGTPALFVPLEAAGDQVFRAHRLAELGIADVIGQADVTREAIAETIVKGLSCSRVTHAIALDGAEKTQAFVSGLATQRTAESDPIPTKRKEIGYENLHSTPVP